MTNNRRALGMLQSRGTFLAGLALLHRCGYQTRWGHGCLMPRGALPSLHH